MALRMYEPACSADILTSLKTPTPSFVRTLLPAAAVTLAAWPLPSTATALGFRTTCSRPRIRPLVLVPGCEYRVLGYWGN